MKIDMDVRGTQDLNRKLRRLSEIVIDLSGQKVIASCRRVVSGAKALAAVRTGAMKASITYSTEGTRGYVGIRNTSPARVYWRFIEFGTVHVVARPFFRPAAEAERDKFVTDLSGIGRALERV